MTLHKNIDEYINQDDSIKEILTIIEKSLLEAHKNFNIAKIHIEYHKMNCSVCGECLLPEEAYENYGKTVCSNCR